jgi:dTDP-4-amino-4,6-dideoxygalactose transaminase
MTKPLPFLDLKAQFASICEEVLEAVHRNLESQQLILGPEVDAFEKEISALTNCTHAIACNLSIARTTASPGSETAKIILYSG